MKASIDNESLKSQFKDQLKKKLDPKQLKQLAKQLKASHFAEDSQAAKYMKNAGLKAIFNILLKVSYSLFTIGLIVTIGDGTLNQDSFVQYVKDSSNKSLLIMLCILGFIILIMLRELRGDDTLEAAQKKTINLFVDILRLIFYVLIIVFIRRFVFQDHSDNYTLLGAFWVFVVCLTLFLFRRTMKWCYFLGSGKEQLGPWQSKSNSEMLKNLTLMNFYMEKRTQIQAQLKSKLKNKVNNVKSRIKEKISPIIGDEEDLINEKRNEMADTIENQKGGQIQENTMQALMIRTNDGL